jgi:hypothetical protein
MIFSGTLLQACQEKYIQEIVFEILLLAESICKGAAVGVVALRQSPIPGSPLRWNRGQIIQGHRMEVDAHYLAMIDNYRLPGKMPPFVSLSGTGICGEEDSRWR